MANEFTALPEISKDMQRIASALLEVGPVLSGDMGPKKVTWSELESWYIMTDSDLSGWELSCLMNASRSYIDCIREYDEKTVNSPYDRILTNEEREIEASNASGAEEAFYDKVWGHGKEE